MTVKSPDELLRQLLDAHRALEKYRWDNIGTFPNDVDIPEEVREKWNTELAPLQMKVVDAHIEIERWADIHHPFKA